jgi:rubrerythrin
MHLCILEGFIMRSIKGSNTEKNLLKAFAGESQARNRYTYFAAKAKKDGYVQIAQIFELTAEQERSHAKNFFKFLEGGELEIITSFPAGVIGTTEENLAAAAAGEKIEYSKLYPGFAEEAGREGFDKVATKFRAIAKAEESHEKRFRKLLENIQNGKVFQRDTKVSWECMKCGYIYDGKKSPSVCAACGHPHTYFSLRLENW